MGSHPNQQQPSHQTIGNLPFVSAEHFGVQSCEYWTREHGMWHWEAGIALEHLQRQLHEQSLVEGSVDLNSVCRGRNGRKARWYRKIPKVPYHEDIQPHWDAFVEAKASRGGMEQFQIHDIMLPPWPFFQKSLMPLFEKSCASLTRLELDHCGLGQREIGCVAAILRHSPSLSTLDLSSNTIHTGLSIRLLSVAMKEHQQLRFASFSNCGLGHRLDVLSTLLSGSGNLECLVLEGNGFGSAAVARVADFLACNTSITVFSLKYTGISDDSASLLGRALRKNTSLRQLCLGTNGLCCPTFLDSKRATELLTHLDLSANTITSEGTKVIANYLARNPPLVELDLSKNKLTSSTASCLTSALKLQNTTLQHLDLRSNSYNDKAVPFFADLLRHNTTLLSLNILYNKFKVETGRKELIKRALCDTSSLDAIVESNHTCTLALADARYADTHEVEMRKINLLESEGQKIRSKVLLALFAMDNDLFNARTFDDVPLELMPRLLELVQQEVVGCGGCGGSGEEVVEKARKKNTNRCIPTLERMYEVIRGWSSMPLLFVTSPVKTEKRMKRKLRDPEDTEWTSKSRRSV